MAKRSNRVELVVSREEAKSVVMEAIERGRVIAGHVGQVRDDDTFTEWAAEASRWRKYAVAVLHSISAGDALEEEFRAATRRVAYMLGGPPETIGERLDRRRGDLLSEINVLESVVERLPVLPEPAGAKAAAGSGAAASEVTGGTDVFIVHGRQTESAEIVARFVERLGLNVIILHERPNRGATLIEKIEQNTTAVGFAVVLMLADDWGRGPDDDAFPEEPNRARENVVLELGYFVGKIGRQRVAALMGPGVERPSDIHGLAYIPFDDSWKLRLMQEMKAVFPDLDANLALE
jgi:predicted nucleotide-binding protein